MDNTPHKKHGGSGRGQGRKPAPPEHGKRRPMQLWATDSEWTELMQLLPDNGRDRFLKLLELARNEPPNRP